MKAIALLALVIGVTAASQADACLCFEKSVATAYAQAKAVFIGTVVSDDYIRNFRGSGYAYHVYTLSVNHSWKGMTKSVPVIGGGESSCDITLRMGETLLIYGNTMGGGDTVDVSLCSRIRDLEKAGDDIRALNYLTGRQWIVEAALGAAAIDNDDWNPGFSVDAALRYVILPHLSLRTCIAFSHLPFAYKRKLADPEHSSGRGMEVVSVSMEAIWRLSADRSVLSPYIAAGPGFTWYQADEGEFQVGGVAVEGSSGSAPGIFGGIGLDVPLGARISLFLEGQISANLQDVPMNSIGMGLVSGVQVLL